MTHQLKMNRFTINELYRANYVIMVQISKSAPVIHGNQTYSRIGAEEETRRLNYAFMNIPDGGPRTKNFGTLEEPIWITVQSPKLERHRFFYKRIVCKL